MHKYGLIFKLSLLDIFQYRVDFFLHTLKYATMILMMAFVWTAVGRDNPSFGFNQNQIVSYFFFAAMLYSLSNFHPVYIEEDIKLGALSRFLLKPLSPYLFYLSHEAANAVLETFLKVVVMLPLLHLSGLSVVAGLPQVLVIILYLPVIFIFAFDLLTLISTLTFWLNEAWALRWSLTIIFRLLSGILVPISLFPVFLQPLLMWLPFPYLAFIPIQLLLNNISLETGLRGLGLLGCWTVGLHLFRLWLWKQGIKKYESVGI